MVSNGVRERCVNGEVHVGGQPNELAGDRGELRSDAGLA
jgi:hypothetical protein